MLCNYNVNTSWLHVLENKLSYKGVTSEALMVKVRLIWFIYEQLSICVSHINNEMHAPVDCQSIDKAEGYLSWKVNKTQSHKWTIFHNFIINELLTVSISHDIQI